MTSRIEECFPFKNAKKGFRLYELPTEILVNIMEYLSPEDRQRFQHISKYAASLIADFPSLTLSTIYQIFIGQINRVQPEKGGKRLKIKDFDTNQFLITKAYLINELVIDFNANQLSIAKMIAMMEVGRIKVDYLILQGYDGSNTMNQIIKLAQPRKLFIKPRFEEITIDIPASCSYFLFQSRRDVHKICLDISKATKLQAYCIYNNERSDCAFQANHNVNKYQRLIIKALLLIPHLKDKMKLETEIKKLGNDVEVFEDINGFSFSHESDNFLQIKTQ